MLVLTRGIGQKIILKNGDKTIEIVLVAIKGDRARIGIQAPLDIEIHREEVAERIAAGVPSPLTGNNNDGESPTTGSNKEKQEKEMWGKQKREQRKSRFTDKTK